MHWYACATVNATVCVRSCYVPTHVAKQSKRQVDTHESLNDSAITWWVEMSKYVHEFALAGRGHCNRIELNDKHFVANSENHIYRTNFSTIFGNFIQKNYQMTFSSMLFPILADWMSRWLFFHQKRNISANCVLGRWQMNSLLFGCHFYSNRNTCSFPFSLSNCEWCGSYGKLWEVSAAYTHVLSPLSLFSNVREKWTQLELATFDCVLLCICVV